MERNIDMNEISDGKRYGAGDMVKADCGNCQGCSACCRGMGTSVVLDPYDIYRFTAGLRTTFQALMTDRVELNVVDGIILPNLKMAGEKEQCVFLNAEGRCSIHAIRPGFCRLFPLGRIYEDGSFYYFLQIHECRKENRSKVKVRKWIDTPDFRTYEKFICDWHYYLKDLSGYLKEKADDAGQEAREISMYILNQFYIRAYDSKIDFYSQFYQRLEEGKEKYRWNSVR